MKTSKQQDTARKVFQKAGSKCGKCAGPLAFYKNARGNWCPCNPDGTDHWDVCRERLYAVAKTGEHVNTAREEAYYRTDKSTGEISRFAVRESAPAIGKVNTICHCDIRPWDQPCEACPVKINWRRA